MLQLPASMSFVVNSKTLKLIFSGSLIYLTFASSAAAPVESFKPSIVGFSEPVVLATAKHTIDRQSFHSKTFIPKRLIIPSIDVDATIEPVGKDQSNRMDTPDHIDEVGWYRYGARAGEVGNVVLSGHLDDLNGPAIFADLATIRIGELVTLQRNEQVANYEVVSVERYAVEDVPLASIFAATQSTRLQLITCAGTFDPKLGYRERIVVTALIQT